MGKNKPLAKTGEEFDVVTGWRHVLAYMRRPGVTKRIKTTMNRRFRRQSKRNLNQERDDDK